jgi:F0F1-type ATP synthase membrane subunit c/vacuolar-type H+-ATPase subunit K
LKAGSSLISGLTVAVLAAALVLAGYGAAVAVGGVGNRGVSTTTVTSTTNSTASSPYVVTLVIATDSIFNSTAQDQPAYFILGPNGLQSSAKINLPADRLIKLIIFNYDDGNATLEVPNDNVVSGTTNGTIFVASNSNINSSQATSGISVNGGQTLSSVPVSDVAHTFTVPSLNLNIPVPTSSIVVAYFTVDKAGTYIWLCETSCGDAAMTTAGWMTGSLVAS